MEGSREREGGREGGMEEQRNRGTKGDAKERDLQSEVSCDSVRKKRAAATRRPRANQHAVTLTHCVPFIVLSIHEPSHLSLKTPLIPISQAGILRLQEVSLA